MNEKAYSLVHFNEQWGVMELKFSLSGEVSQEMVFTPCGKDKSEAVEQFKIMISNLF
jgi:hypothetical protein